MVVMTAGRIKRSATRRFLTLTIELGRGYAMTQPTC